MRTKNYVFVGLVSLFIFFAIGRIGIHAQLTDQTLEQMSTSGQNKIPESFFAKVATVDIYDAGIVRQENGNFTIGFNLHNEEKNQPQVIYSVILKNQGSDGAADVIDRMIYREDVVSLSQGQTLHKEIAYSAPDYLTGKYDLFVEARNKSGLLFSSVPLGEFELSGSGGSVEIMQKTCKIKSDGQDNIMNGQTTFESNPGTQQIVVCDVLNNTKVSQEMFAIADSYKLSIYGDRLATEKSDAVALAAGEKKAMDFSVPAQQKAGIYELSLSVLNSQNKQAGSPISISQQVPGAGVAINNLLLDKDYYKKDDKANVTISLGITGFADDMSRISSGKISINMSDKNGQVCTTETEKPIEKDKIVNDNLILNITNDCMDPSVMAKVIDSNGIVLAQEKFEFKTADKKSTVGPGGNISDDSWWYGAVKNGILVYILGVVGVILIGLLTWKIVKRSRITKLFVFGIIALGGLASFGVNNASAATFSVTGVCSGWAVAFGTVTMSTNKASYTPGEAITVNVSDTTNVSANGCFLYNQNYDIGTNVKDYPSATVKKPYVNTTVGWNVTTSGSTSYTAPAALGAYTIGMYTINAVTSSFGGGGYGWYGGTSPFINGYSNAEITYSVANPVYACTGTVPSNATLIAGDDVGLIANVVRTVVPANTATKCEYICNAGYVKSGAGNFCVAAACTGAVPANATLVPGDDTGLIANVARTVVPANTATKCEYLCNSGYVPSGGACVAVTYSCTGIVPANATLIAGDDVGLIADVPRSLVLANTATKCEYTCNSPFTKVGSSCICDVSCGAWSSCSDSCGGGTQTQTCTDCHGNIIPQSQACNTQACSTGGANWREVSP